MTDGRRKSIQATAEQLPDGNEQNLQQFVNQSTWIRCRCGVESPSGWCRWWPGCLGGR
ncbi:hypothetical protein AB0N17_44000 [Streptomyces sp. NPDC051133]|uniref:hypothetical protein n=1 Tax=Streptomyces sp. NPDC051133 TaxID=3155521 RepID=UPI00342BED2B